MDIGQTNFINGLVLDDFFYFMYSYRKQCLQQACPSDGYQIGIPIIHDAMDNGTTICAGGREMTQ